MQLEVELTYYDAAFKQVSYGDPPQTAVLWGAASGIYSKQYAASLSNSYPALSQGVSLKSKSYSQTIVLKQHD